MSQKFNTQSVKLPDLGAVYMEASYPAGLVENTLFI